MRRIRKLSRLLALSLIFLATPSLASPLGISLFPPLQFPLTGGSVTGIRLNTLWGKHQNVRGLDLGVFGNVSSKEFFGIGIAGGFNSLESGTIFGLQVAGVTNLSSKKLTVLGVQIAGVLNLNRGDTRIIGLQVAGLVNTTQKKRSTFVGLQVAGAANNAHSTFFYGLQLAPFNSAWEVTGLQIGAFNDAHDVYGIQIGIINRTENLDGLQIGLINIVGSSALKVFPIIRIGFS